MESVSQLQRAIAFNDDTLRRGRQQNRAAVRARVYSQHARIVCLFRGADAPSFPDLAFKPAGGILVRPDQTFSETQEEPLSSYYAGRLKAPLLQSKMQSSPAASSLLFSRFSTQHLPLISSSNGFFASRYAASSAFPSTSASGEFLNFYLSTAPLPVFTFSYPSSLLPSFCSLVHNLRPVHLLFSLPFHDLLVPK